MKYIDLIKRLESLIAESPEIAGQDVTVYDENADEFYAMQKLETSNGADTLDDGHAYLSF